MSFLSRLFGCCYNNNTEGYFNTGNPTDRSHANSPNKEISYNEDPIQNSPLKNSTEYRCITFLKGVGSGFCAVLCIFSRCCKRTTEGKKTDGTNRTEEANIEGEAGDRPDGERMTVEMQAEIAKNQPPADL